MPDIGDDDVFEAGYVAELQALLAQHGILLDYRHDRAAIDAGVHLYARDGGTTASQTRVWFQAKGKRASTLPADEFARSQTVAVRVSADHLRFWYAAPEPVYLAVYVESVRTFLAADVRDLVDEQWPAGTFYSSLPASQQTVTLHVPTPAVLDGARVRSMLAHRSMRIDGPSFRGRPLGHRLDPLRSQIAPLPPETLQRLVRRLLAEHDFRPTDVVEVSYDLQIVRGRLYQTMEWQSPAFAEYGYGPDDDLRQEPDVESLHGDVHLVLDLAEQRTQLTVEEQQRLWQAMTADAPSAAVAVVFNGKDLSSTGGVWRSALRERPEPLRNALTRMIGLEALTSLMLVATLVYLDFAPDVVWDHVNYRD